MPESLLEKYRRLLADGKIAPDSAQALGVEKLQILTNRLINYTPPARTDFFSFFTRRRGEVPKGLYIFGAVGRGKTMLMDLFSSTVAVKQKRRAHFHEFMADVHARLAAARREAKEDPIVAVAKTVAAEARLLCLDELFVIDIADATILRRLFATLFQAGTIVVVTSNSHPRDLYKDGRNRDLFLPFIDLIEENMELLQLEAARDFRLGQIGSSPLYFSPLGPSATAAIDDLWRRLTFGEPCREEALTVLGHELAVPRASFGAARFAFADLFDKPLGAADYIALGAPLPHDLRRRHPRDGQRTAQRGAPLHHFHRHDLRPPHRLYRLRRGRARCALPHGRRRAAFRAHRVQAHGNAPAAIFARSLPGRPAAPGLSAIGFGAVAIGSTPHPAASRHPLPQGERVRVLVAKAPPLPSASACGCGHLKRQARQGELARERDWVRGNARRNIGKALSAALRASGRCSRASPGCYPRFPGRFRRRRTARGPPGR